MTKKITDLVEVTQTEDGDLLLIRDATDGVDKKLQAQNLRAKATTKADVGLGSVPDLDTTDAVNKAHDQNTDTALDQGGANEVTAADARAHIDATDNPHGVTKAQVGLSDVDNVSAADLRDRSTHTGTQTLSTISDAGTIASQDANSVNIGGGNIDGTPIGVLSASEGNFTTLDANGDVTIAEKIVHAGDTNTAIRFPSADTVTFETAGNEAMRIDSSGNVGIGSSNFSSAKLNVFASSPPDDNQGITAVIGLNQTNMGVLRFTSGRDDTALTNRYSTIQAFSNFNRGTGTGAFQPLVLQPDGGNVGIGTTSPSGKLHLNVSDAAADVIKITNGTQNLNLGVNNSSGGSYLFESGSNALRFGTSNTERMRIDSSGNVLIGKTVGGATADGVQLSQNFNEFVGSGARIAVFNRRLTDGTLLEFRHADSTEGTISVSGTTVSYNGGHLSRWSRLPSGEQDSSILKGTVMTNLDEMVEWGDEENEQLNQMAVSSVEGDPNVAGVFVNWDNDDDWNDMNVAMTGDMIIRIGAGVTVKRGDLLMSTGDGTAKPQGDDVVKSKTIAKVTSTHVTCTYDDGSYCVPCVLMAC